ncbi:hypothetical protein [Pseudolactococcus insecticola]|uniref:Uncharacterized protein n=1 Tax=Pseudolactococcus insecticola TaxID=2709158 RepID=A0A6A0BA13_9LACT|nr:hypothetical protein [Lactococcus insecticola]GFH40657.1 hypothetical protein Hs20B_10550 [Lactococcus insecticola]
MAVFNKYLLADGATSTAEFTIKNPAPKPIAKGILGHFGEVSGFFVSFVGMALILTAIFILIIKLRERRNGEHMD